MLVPNSDASHAVARRLPAFVFVLAALLAACSSSTTTVFRPPGGNSLESTWTGLVAPGELIEIKGVNGNIDARPGTGTTARVKSERHVDEDDEDDPASVSIVVVEHAGGVTICAVYPDAAGQPPNVCAPGDGGDIGASDSQVSVNFEVDVPPGVRLRGTTVNGNIQAEALSADAFGFTVNGNVELETTGIAEASTLNGNLVIAIGDDDWGQDLDFTTVNGNVRVTIPGSTDSDVVATTLNGNFVSDFSIPETGQGRWEGTIGAGGDVLTLGTLNGNIELFSGG